MFNKLLINAIKISLEFFIEDGYRDCGVIIQRIPLCMYRRCKISSASGLEPAVFLGSLGLVVAWSVVTRAAPLMRSLLLGFIHM